MPAFSTEVPHSLTADEAKQRVHSLMQSIDEQYPGMVNNLTSEWNANVLSLAFSVYGFSVKSDLAVYEERVAIAGNIPLTAMPFKSKIQAAISEKLGELLS